MPFCREGVAVSHLLPDIEAYVQSPHPMRSKARWAAIAGASELLEEDNVPPAQKRRFLSNIRTESKRIQSLVDRMLTLCALEHRETIERREIVDMNMVLADVLRRSGQEVLTREICIVKILAMACECPGDAFLITQAVMNLFQNALEFSPRGAADTGVTLKRSGETVVVEIRDQGPGYPGICTE